MCKESEVLERRLKKANHKGNSPQSYLVQECWRLLAIMFPGSDSMI